MNSNYFGVPILASVIIFGGFFVGGKITDEAFAKPDVSLVVSVFVDCEAELVMIFSDVDTGEVFSRCSQNPELTPDEYRTDEWRALKEKCKDGAC